MHTPEELISIRPSARQLSIMELGFYAFIHFTVNTFTGREWGDGTESPDIFCPTDFDARQWTDAVKAAGMKGLILTCKHHDGFCLWPSRYTEHSVKNSPWKNGKGDIVREVSDACHEAGLAFGIYLSPWDRHEAAYGQGKAYDDYFVHQLEELLTNYGPIFAVWFDGACGEGPNGKKQYYDWDRYYETVRRLQPSACMSVCGPDVRWCGNEAGQTRESEWSVVSRRMLDTERIASLSQQKDDADFRLRPIRARDADLGSREALAEEKELIWYPAEVNTSIRPGWFYHQEEDDKVKTASCLRELYLRTVGGNACFLLNIPPDRRGRLADQDVQELKALGSWIREAFSGNLLETCSITDNGHVPGHGADELVRENGTFEAAQEKAEITICLPKELKAVPLGYLVLREDVRQSQRVEAFSVDVLQDDEWTNVYNGTVIGSRKIVPVLRCARSVRIRIHACRMNPILSFAGLYRQVAD